MMNLRDVRKALGLTQTQTADLIGVNQATVSRLENSGKPVAAETAIVIEQETRGKLTRTQMRPDLWPEGWCSGPKPGKGTRAA